MRKFLLIMLATAAMAGNAQAETIKTTVNGMVCAFCAAGIEKSFKNQQEVDAVKVDLDHQMVTINTKKGQVLSDERITKVINDAGFSIEKISRDKDVHSKSGDKTK